MTLYEIDKAILDAIERGTDPETGEVTDTSELMALNIERGQKIENIACYIKNLVADASAIKDEIDALAKRKKAAESKAERLKSLLLTALAGDKFETGKCSVSYRRSTAVEIEDACSVVEWAGQDQELFDRLVRVKAPEVNKSAIGAYIKSGHEVPGAKVVERTTVVVR